MNIFRREPTAETIGLSQGGPSLYPESASTLECGPDYCAEGDPVANEHSPKQEVLLEELDTVTLEWVRSLAEGRNLATEVQSAIIDMSTTHMRATANNRGDRRNAEQIIERNVTNDMMTFRKFAIRDVNAYAGFLNGANGVKEVLLSGEPTRLWQMQALLQKIDEKRFASTREDAQSKRSTGIVLVGPEKYVNPYHKVFVRETVARTKLAELMIKVPDAMRSLLNPANLQSLPRHMQQLIATDIASESSSIVLKFMADQEESVTDLFDYLNDNEIGQSAKEYAKAIALGAKAMGSCVCPLNSLGICAGVADKIPPEQLPKDILADMQRKQHDAKNRILTQLRGFGQANKISQWWTMNGEVTSVSKHSGKAPATHSGTNAAVTQQVVRNLQESLTVDQAPEIVGPVALRISYKGGDGVLEARVADDDAMAEVIQSLMTGNLIARYLKNYQSRKGMEQFVSTALHTILTAENYREEPSIMPMRYLRPHYSAVDNERLSMWRLSGRGFRGASGKEAIDTRIYFGMSGAGSTRRVEIVKIANKGGIVKQSQRGTSI